MTSPAPAHYIFVDFENVPAVDLTPIASTPAAHVMLLLGKNQRRMDLALVKQIKQLGDRLTLTEVGASGHNALDLTLAYYLGRAATEHPHASFHIISKDADFDPLIAHLHVLGIAVDRHPNLATLPFLSRPKRAKPTPPSPRPAADHREKVIARLKDPANKNRPATKRALLAHIRTALGKSSAPEVPEEIVRNLVDQHALTIDPATEKIGYERK